MRDPVIEAAIKASCEVGDALDYAEVKIRTLEEDVARERAFTKLVAARLRCGCWSKDCRLHGAYDPEDHVRLHAITDPK